MAKRSTPPAIGRPPKITATRVNAIVKAVEVGAPRTVAAEAAGIHEATLYRWVAQGEDPKAARLYRELREALTRADAQVEVEALTAWKAAWQDDWRAAMEYLARTRPSRYGRRERLDIDVRIQAQMRLVAEQLGLPPDAIPEMERELRALVPERALG